MPVIMLEEFVTFASICKKRVGTFFFSSSFKVF